MQQEWDIVDKLIVDSMENYKTDSDFNSKILMRINNEKKGHKNPSAALSLIATGLLLLTIYTGGLQYNLIDIKYKVKLEFITLQNNFIIQQNVLGE